MPHSKAVCLAGAFSLAFLIGALELHAQCPADFTVSLQSDAPVCQGKPIHIQAVTSRTGVQFAFELCGGFVAIPYSEYSTTTLNGPTSRCVQYPNAIVKMRDPITHCETQSAPVPLTWTAFEGGQWQAPQGMCGNTTTTISMSKGEDFTNIQWDVSGGTILSGQGTPSITVQPTNPGYPMFTTLLSHTHIATGCSYGPSDPQRTDTGVPTPQQTISAPSSICTRSIGTASIPSGPTFIAWSITNGLITSNPGLPSIQFAAGTSGTVGLSVTYLASGYNCPSTSTASVPIVGAAAAVRPSGQSICLGDSTSVTADLYGTPPFTVTWSDGEIQQATTAQISRTVSPDDTTTYSIVNVSNGNSCNTAGIGSATVTVLDDPQIVDQTLAVTVAMDTSAKLYVVPADPNVSIAWFELSADGQRTFRGNGPTFSTPKLQRSTRYIAELVNACGVVTSEPISVTVGQTRRRAVTR